MSLATSANSKCSNSTDAMFRAWGLMISTQLAAAGLVKTSDTGTVNWATVTAPASAPLASGFEIWRFADALQSTRPVFIKIEYGSSGAATAPGMWFTFGSGSDGAGNLTGTLSTRMSLASSSQYTTNDLTSYFSGDTNRFVAALWASGTGAAGSHFMFFSFERSLDSSGVVTNEAVLFISNSTGGGTSYQQVAWNTTTGQATAVEISLGILTPNQGTGSSGSQLSVYPVFFAKGAFFNPGLNVLGYFNSDIGAISTVSFTVYAATHTYITLGTTVATPSLRGTGTSLMMRYE